MAKINIPIGLDGKLDYSDESRYLNSLIYMTDRTNAGQATFTSVSSNITYNTADYPDNPEIYNRGEVGIIHLLQTLYGGQDGFLMMADDYNRVAVVETPTTLQASVWTDSETEGIYMQTVTNTAIHSTSSVDLKASYSEYALHITEPYTQLFCDNVAEGSVVVYCVSADKPQTDYNVTLIIRG